MIERILSIAGKPGLYRLVSQGKNMLIVENVETGKRMPAYSRDKVISLADVAIYTTGEDMPLYEVFEKVSEKNDARPVDMSKLKEDAALRDYFAEVLPEYDRDRVYTNDIRKLFSWYNILVSNGVTDFKMSEISEDEAAEAAEKADEENSTDSEK